MLTKEDKILVKMLGIKKYGEIRLTKDFQTRNGARGCGEISEAIANDGVH